MKMGRNCDIHYMCTHTNTCLEFPPLTWRPKSICAPIVGVDTMKILFSIFQIQNRRQSFTKSHNYITTIFTTVF